MEVIYKGSADGIRLRLGIGIVATIGGSQQMKLHPLQGTRNGDAIGAREGEGVKGACCLACTFESDNCKLCKIINFKLTICRPHRARLFTECTLSLYLAVYPADIPARECPTYTRAAVAGSSSMPRSDAGPFMHCTKLATPGYAHAHAYI